jgi:hypothetical protein
MGSKLNRSDISIGLKNSTEEASALKHLRDADNNTAAQAFKNPAASGRTYNTGTGNFSNYKLTEQHRDLQSTVTFNGGNNCLDTINGHWLEGGGSGTTSSPPECKMSHYVKPASGNYDFVNATPEPDDHTRATVLCTAVHELGYISDDVLKGDNLIYEKKFKDTYVYDGYLIFAKYYLYLLHNSNFWRPLIALMVSLWAKYMAYKMGTYHKSNFTGALLTLMGIICLWPIGLLSKISKNKYYRNTLSAFILGITIGPLCLYSSILTKIKGVK